MRIVLSAPTDKASLFEGCMQIDVTDALITKEANPLLVASENVQFGPFVCLPDHDFPISAATYHKLRASKLEARNIALVEENRSVLFGFFQVEDAKGSIHVLSSNRIDSSAPPERRYGTPFTTSAATDLTDPMCVSTAYLSDHSKLYSPYSSIIE